MDALSLPSVLGNAIEAAGHNSQAMPAVMMASPITYANYDPQRQPLESRKAQPMRRRKHLKCAKLYSLANFGRV